MTGLLLCLAIIPSVALLASSKGWRGHLAQVAFAHAEESPAVHTHPGVLLRLHLPYQTANPVNFTV
eukprot:COSAG05_NODE_23836_length_255_cov_0.839744_1_plen_65_part_10